MKKLHQAFFYALIILLPVQLGRHFWPEWSYVLGLKIDYLSPTLYLTDILVGLILVSWFLEKLNELTINNLQLTIRKFWWVGAILFYLLTTSLLAQNSGAALYKFIKIIELFFLGLYVAKNSYTPSALRQILPFPIIYTSFLAIAQFINQSSLNGSFWWLGERTFNVATPGIAKAIVNGQLLMRPYATFPHPNALAGFILVSLALMGMPKRELTSRKILKWLTIGFGGAAIAISFSRSTWVVGLLIILLLVVLRLWKKKKRFRQGIFLVFLLTLLGGVFYWGPKLSTEETFNLRFQSTKVASLMVQPQLLTGVGLNNFISQLSYYWPAPETIRFLQPVHNIFLLILAETGLVGLVIFVWLLILTFKKLLATGNWQLAISLLAIFLTGMVDHYWLTLQQTQLLLTIVLGLSWANRQ